MPSAAVRRCEGCGATNREPTGGAPGSVAVCGSCHAPLVVFAAGADHYETLRVARSASAEEVRAAWRAEVKRSHPDNHPEAPTVWAERFRAVSEAFEVLSDPQRRSAYDEVLNDPDAAGDGDGLDDLDPKSWVLRAVVGAVESRVDADAEPAVAEHLVNTSFAEAAARLTGPERASSPLAAKVAAYRAMSGSVSSLGNREWPPDAVSLVSAVIVCVWVAAQKLWVELPADRRELLPRPLPSPPKARVARSAPHRPAAATSATALRPPPPAAPPPPPAETKSNRRWWWIAAAAFLWWAWANDSDSDRSSSPPRSFAPPAAVATWRVGACVDAVGARAAPVSCSSPYADGRVVASAVTSYGCPYGAETYVPHATGVWCIDLG